MARLKINKSSDKQYQYQVFARNGEHLVTSETYTKKASAKRGFQDLSDAVLNILSNQDALIDALERNGLLKKLNDSL